MKVVGRMKSLRALSLCSCCISDAGMTSIASLTDLRVLRLGGCNISDAGVAKLEWLKRLEHLDLRDTGVSDAGLEHLQGLLALRTLDVDGTRVTGDGLAALQRALPKCDISCNSPNGHQQERVQFSMRPLLWDEIRDRIWGRKPSGSGAKKVRTEEWGGGKGKIGKSGSKGGKALLLAWHAPGRGGIRPEPRVRHDRRKSGDTVPILEKWVGFDIFGPGTGDRRAY